MLNKYSNTDFFFNLKNSLRLVPKKLKLKIYLLIFFNLITNIFEVLGIFLVIPITALFLGLGNDNYSEYLMYLKNSFVILNNQSSLIILSLFFFSIFFIKYCFSIYNQIYQYSLIKNIKNHVSNKLIKAAYNKDWKDWINENKSNLYQNVINSSDLFCYQYLLQLFLLASEFLFLLILLIIFLINFTFQTLISSVIIILLISFYYKFVVQSYMYKKGKIRWVSDNKRIQYLNEIIISMKDIIMFNKQDLFYNKFSQFEDRFNDTNKSLGIFSQLPRLFLEFFFILLFITILILSSNLVESDKIKYFPYLATFLVLLIRIMPSVNKIISSVQQIRFSQKSVSQLNKAIKFSKIDINKNFNKVKFLKEIKLTNIFFKYNKKSKNIFVNLSLVIKKNTIIGIEGDNGSGKSTLVDIIAGLLTPNKGDLTCDNKNISGENLKNKVAIISQRPLLINETILNNILLGAKLDNKKLEEVINLSDLKNLIKLTNKGINSIIGDSGNLISSGQMQRLAIARALYANKEILIFDEATNAIDENSEKKIMSSLLKLRKDKTIIIISHNKKNFFHCNKIYKIKKYKLQKN
jgi:ATP-binding cassette, subfamily B, bacterial PglK